MGDIIVVDGFKVPIGNHLGKNIVIGSDHRGFEKKRYLADYLKNSKNRYMISSK